MANNTLYISTWQPSHFQATTRTPPRLTWLPSDISLKIRRAPLGDCTRARERGVNMSEPVRLGEIIPEVYADIIRRCERYRQSQAIELGKRREVGSQQSLRRAKMAESAAEHNKASHKAINGMELSHMRAEEVTAGGLGGETRQASVERHKERVFAAVRGFFWRRSLRVRGGSRGVSSRRHERLKSASSGHVGHQGG